MKKNFGRIIFKKKIMFTGWVTPKATKDESLGISLVQFLYTNCAIFVYHCAIFVYRVCNFCIPTVQFLYTKSF